MSEQSKTVQFQNTNAWDTRQLVTMALMAAIGALLAFVAVWCLVVYADRTGAGP